MRKLFPLFLVSLLSMVPAARATIFGQVRGVVHDPQHRPIDGARVELRSANSTLTFSATTVADGAFSIPSVPLGDYIVTVAQPGFATLQQPLTLASDASPILHLELHLGAVNQTVSVSAATAGANVNTVTPTTLVDRRQIAQTPGADRTNSMAMITDYVPGAYMTHDMLHMRGGHQLNWQIDGVEIPNTNIASNLAAQISPKDIDYLEVQRGSYTADIGDRTYGVFNIVPRSGFSRDRTAELILNAGNFNQTDDQLNFGDHTEKFAYYASLSGNRSDYGLAPPIPQVFHDADNGFGGFASLIYNRTSKDQLRLLSLARQDFFQVPYDPNPNDFENQQYNSSGLRDGQRETDIADAFSYLHTFNAATVLQVSPFFHYNQVNYAASPSDLPVATTYNRATTYAGGQLSIDTQIARNSLQAGLYSFGQHDHDIYAAAFNDASFNNFSNPTSASGGVVEEYISDSYKPTSWLTFIGGLRATQFRASVAEDATDPRIGIALRVPKLNWVFRAFYGRFYQPPPLLTVQCGATSTGGPASNCSVQQYAQSTGTSFAALHGERDEEHQFGVAIPLPRPLTGWLLDADTFKTRAANFLDHGNVGESSIYFPITVQGALIQAWELTIRTPHLWRFGQGHLAYSNQLAQQRGPITGGLVCYPASSPACAVAPGYTPLDHDQRNTLSIGFNATLPWHAYASANYAFGSGFHNGDPDPTTPYPSAYLPYNTSLDLSVGKTFSDKLSASISATNVTNRRTLLDNSLTYGGFHDNDPRQIFAEIRYRFHY